MTLVNLDDAEFDARAKGVAFSSFVQANHNKVYGKPSPIFSKLTNGGVSHTSDPFAKIAKAISGGLGKIKPKPSDMLGMATKKQYKVPKGTTITIPRPNATLPVDRRDVAAGQMIISRKAAIYEEEELILNDLFERTYVFKLPFNNKEIPYILVDHKRTTVVYIIELPGDLNEEIF